MIVCVFKACYELIDQALGILNVITSETDTQLVEIISTNHSSPRRRCIILPVILFLLSMVNTDQPIFRAIRIPRTVSVRSVPSNPVPSIIPHILTLALSLSLLILLILRQL